MHLESWQKTFFDILVEIVPRLATDPLLGMADGIAIQDEEFNAIVYHFLGLKCEVSGLGPDIMIITEDNLSLKGLTVHRFDEEDAAERGAPLQLLWFDEVFA